MKAKLRRVMRNLLPKDPSRAPHRYEHAGYAIPPQLRKDVVRKTRVARENNQPNDTPNRRYPYPWEPYD